MQIALVCSWHETQSVCERRAKLKAEAFVKQVEENMQLVEQHIIRKGDPRSAKIDAAAFASKNLWNAANYLVRQAFIFQHIYLNNVEVSLDLGVNNLAALTSNVPGFVPVLINGRPLKSINRLYNKQRAHIQQCLAKENRFTSLHLERLTDKR